MIYNFFHSNNFAKKIINLTLMYFVFSPLLATAAGPKFEPAMKSDQSYGCGGHHEAVNDSRYCCPKENSIRLKPASSTDLNGRCVSCENRERPTLNPLKNEYTCPDRTSAPSPTHRKK